MGRDTRRFSRSILSLLLVVAMADARATNALCPEPLQVGYYDFGAHYQPETGQGIDVDVIEELMRRIGCKVQGRMLSRVLIWRMMAAGTLDLTPSALDLPERRPFADFVPYFQSRNEAVLRRGASGTALTATAFAADDHLKFGVVRSFRHGEGWDAWISAMREQGRVTEVPDSRTLLLMLEHGRIDGFPAIPSVMDRLLKERGGAAVPFWVRRPWFAEHPVNTSNIALQHERIKPALREQIVQAVLDMRRDGTLEKIFARHLSSADDVRTMLLP